MIRVEKIKLVLGLKSNEEFVLFMLVQNEARFQSYKKGWRTEKL